jgi:molybdenum cofactor cytidylyltransferase
MLSPDRPLPFRSFAIVPAAGRSARMGRPKLLLPWGDVTLIEHVLAVWRGSRVERVVVVTRGDDADLADVCRRCGVDVAPAIPPPPDMRASVRHGLAYVAQTWRPAPADVWLVAPADLPGLTVETIDRVLAAHDPSRPEIIVPRGERRGHPVLFPWGLADEVARLPEDCGINELLRRHAVREVRCEAAAGAGDDLDTPEDYERLRPSDRHEERKTPER